MASAIKTIVAGYMEINKILSEKDARDLMKVKSKSLMDQIERGDLPERWSKSDVALMRYISYYELLPYSKISHYIAQARTQEAVYDTPNIFTDPPTTTVSSPSISPPPQQPPAKKQMTTSPPITTPEPLEGYSIPVREVMVLFVRFLVSPVPYREVFTAFGGGFNQRFYNLLVEVINVANKITRADELAHPEGILSPHECSVLDIYKSALKCGSRRDILKKLKDMVEFFGPQLGYEKAKDTL